MFSVRWELNFIHNLIFKGPDFPWFFSVQEQMLSWHPKSTLHCLLLMQPCPILNSKFQSKCSPRNVIKISSHCGPPLPTQNSAQKPTSFLCCTLPTVHFPSPYLLHFPLLYLTTSVFTRRTSGHYLGTCTAANFFDLPPRLFFSPLSLLVFKALIYCKPSITNELYLHR